MHIPPLSLHPGSWRLTNVMVATLLWLQSELGWIDTRIQASKKLQTKWFYWSRGKLNWTEGFYTGVGSKVWLKWNGVDVAWLFHQISEVISAQENIPPNLRIQRSSLDLILSMKMRSIYPFMILNLGLNSICDSHSINTHWARPHYL